MESSKEVKRSVPGILIRFLSFLIVFALVGTCILHIIVPKFYRDNMLPPSSNYSEFYRMDKNTVDVLFLGSSHAFASYNTQELYDKYGITSYNLGSGNQNLLVSYYWLREALRSQKPKAVVLDCVYLFLFTNTEIPNFVESRIRLGLTYMKWSPVKWQAVRDVCRIDDSETISSYIFPMIRFHDRWEELEDDDFKYGEITGSNHLKGSCETYIKVGGYSIARSKTATATRRPTCSTCSANTSTGSPLCAKKTIYSLS